MPACRTYTDAERRQIREYIRTYKITDDDVDTLLDALAGEHTDNGTPRGANPKMAAARQAYLAKQREERGNG